MRLAIGSGQIGRAGIEVVLDDALDVAAQSGQRIQQRPHLRHAERRLDHRPHPDRLGEGEVPVQHVCDDPVGLTCLRCR